MFTLIFWSHRLKFEIKFWNTCTVINEKHTTKGKQFCSPSVEERVFAVSRRRSATCMTVWWSCWNRQERGLRCGIRTGFTACRARRKCWSEPASRKALPSKNGVHRDACCHQMPPFSYLLTLRIFMLRSQRVSFKWSSLRKNWGWLSSTGDIRSPASTAREVGAEISALQKDTR